MAAGEKSSTRRGYIRGTKCEVPHPVQGMPVAVFDTHVPHAKARTAARWATPHGTTHLLRKVPPTMPRDNLLRPARDLRSLGLLEVTQAIQKLFGQRLVSRRSNPFGSYSIIVFPWLGASLRRTLRGITVL